MNRNDGDHRRPDRSGRAGVMAALVVFALLCGLLLVLLGRQEPRPTNRVDDLALAPRLLALSQTVQQAERSLASSNYGQSREALAQAQRELAKLLSQVQLAEER